LESAKRKIIFCRGGLQGTKKRTRGGGEGNIDGSWKVAGGNFWEFQNELDGAARGRGRKRDRKGLKRGGGTQRFGVLKGTGYTHLPCRRTYLRKDQREPRKGEGLWGGSEFWGWDGPSKGGPIVRRSLKNCPNVQQQGEWVPGTRRKGQ